MLSPTLHIYFKKALALVVWGRRIVLFLFCLFYVSSFSQVVPTSFKATVDSLISAKPKTYFGIDQAIGSKVNDTLLMLYFADVAGEKKYLYGQTYALNQMGRRYRYISQFDRALALHEKALEVAKEAKSLEFEVYSLNMIGVVYRKIDAIKLALDYTQKAFDLADSVKNKSKGIKKSITVSLNNIGNIYQTMEQYDLALEKFRESLIIEEELGSKLGMAINNQNIGECLEAQGDLNGALKKYKISLAYNEEIDSEMGRIICDNSIAKIFIKQDRPEQALEILDRALTVAKELKNQEVISGTYVNLGWGLMQLKRYAEAEKNLQEGLQLAMNYNLPSTISQANELLSELAIKKEDYKSALEYYKKARHFDDEISSDRNIRYVYDILLRHNTNKQSQGYEEEIRKTNQKTDTILLITGIALALLAGIFYILYRQYQLKNEKKLLTLEQSMLRSQMNPHFLFNSLNSIKLYIINNEQKNAVHYLNKFSKLVRKILEASSLREIPLAEELETVELYMNIENIRFSNEINFTITVADDINVHQVKIPSLILQPFLENALWHGLSSKNDEKKINLNITKDDKGFMHISIIDNGVGRKAAEKIKESKVLKRKSVGIAITKERLANFSKDYQNSFDIEIIDLYHDDDTSAGTQVILHIPTI